MKKCRKSGCLKEGKVWRLGLCNEHYLLERPWHKTYRRVWSRCNEKSNDSFKRYGDAGIKLKMKPSDFEIVWYRDSAETMSEPRIHRLDSTCDYTIDNCKYVENVKHRKIHSGTK